MIAISIIIPTCNRLWSLKETVASCKTGKHPVEIIVVDDGSTDGTWEWLATQDDLVSVRQSNWGKCWAVNLGFSMARGKYVRFLDSDDQLPDHCNDEQFELAESAKSDICVSGYKTMNEEGKILREQQWIYCDDFIAQQLGETDSSHYSAYLFRKEFISDIPHRPDYAFRDDRLFVLEAALKHPNVSLHPGYGLLHRVHTRNRLQNQSGAEQIVQNHQHFKLYRKITQLLKETGELTERRVEAAVKILWPLAHWMAKDDIAAAAGIVDYIRELKPGFQFPAGSHQRLFKLLGFTRAQRLFKLMRLVKYGIKS